MTENPPRKPSPTTLVIVAVLSFSLGVFVATKGKDLIDALDGWLENGDTPIIVRDGSIVITSIGEDLDGFSKPHPNVLIHPKTHGKLRQLKANEQGKGTPCQGTRECGVEFVWFTGTAGQSDYQQYTVVVGSNSGDGKTAGIVSSIPFSQYQPSQGPSSVRGKRGYTYTWSPKEKLTFLHARIQTTPSGPRQTRSEPQVICSNPGCKIEFEYK